MKLGEVLIRHSMITQSDLDEALNAQLVYGGSLGTCLVELGYVGERELGNVLSEVFGIAYAPPEAFHEIPRFAIEALPARVAERNHAVPLGLANKVLEVAMVNPKDLAAVDEIQFASGYTVEARVSAEVRIYQALERYYDLPRRLRYVQLCDKLDERETVIRPSASTRRVESGIAGEAKAAPTSGKSSSTATLERSVAAPAPATAVEDSLTETLCRVKDDSMLSQVFLDHVEKTLSRSILFRVKGGGLTVWATRGLPMPEVGQIAITSEPLFRLLAGHDEYTGPLPGGPAHTGFFEMLGFRPPLGVVLAPAYLNDRLIAMLYGDSGVSADLPSEMPSFRKLTDKLALAIGLVDLKRRLREI